MTETISFIKNTLQPLYSPDEARTLAGRIISHVTGLSLHQVICYKDRELSSAESSRITEIIKRLLKEEPLQYILGECDFFDLTFEVNPAVLIPRPETEELIEFILENEKDNSINILDIGTGSGCIAISLARHLRNASVDAVDISPEALAVAKKNAEKNGVHVRFLYTDILHPESRKKVLKEKYDVLVSNPPYVTEKEKTSMEKNVLDYEPHTALFVKEEDPLLFYREIAQLGKNYLIENGSLYFEINRAYGEETVELLKQEGYREIVLRKDLYGNDRMIKAKR